MAASDTEICNLALSELGADRIGSVGEASSKGGRACGVFYPQGLRYLQSQFPWTIVKTRKSLVRLAETPAFGYSYAYQLPADSGKILREDNRDKIYVIEKLPSGTTALLTNDEEINLLYIGKQTDPTKFGEDFTNLLIAWLTWKLSFPMTRNRTLTADNFTIYNGLFSEMEEEDGNQDQPELDANVNIFTEARNSDG